MTNSQINVSPEAEGQISLLNVINFLQESWKKLAIAAITGTIFGFGNWFLLGSYQAQLALINNNSLSVLSLKSLQQTLPILAAQVIDKGQVPDGQGSLYRAMSSPDWWRTTITPVYSLTKADIKDLGVDMKEGSNTILFLNINGVASSNAAAIQNAQCIIQFIHQGFAYLTIEGQIRDQQTSFLSSQADVDSKINSTQVELGYQRARLKNLEELAKRFSSDMRINSQVVDSKDSGAKYLPISTQIIAINTDINGSTESLERLRDRQLWLRGLKEWLVEAEPLVAKSFNGIQINQELMALEEKQRASIGQADPKSLAFLDAVRNSLLVNQARFKFGLVESPTISIKKPGMAKATVGGLVGAVFVMLLALIGQRFWRTFKDGNTK